jgi:surface polysaccharide O-acyltransferase-like enzyme
MLLGVIVLVYLIYTVIEQIALGTLSVWVETYLFNPITYVRLLVLGDLDFIHCGHMWYMVAMLYGYLILYCMEKFRLHKVFYFALPLLLLLRMSMETYTNSFSHFSWFDWHFSGNFLVGAVPVMVLGNYICHNEEKLLSIGKRALTVGATVMMALVFVTVNVKIFDLDLSQPFKIAAATAFFMLCLAVPLERPIPVLDGIGRSLSLHIYIWHVIVGELFRHLLTNAGADILLFEFLLPVATVVATILLSLIFVKLDMNKKKAKIQ